MCPAVRKKAFAIVVLVALASVAACTSNPEPAPTDEPSAATQTAVAAQTTTTAEPGDRRGGTLRIAQATDPASCDLHSARALSYQAVHPCNPMLSQLIRASAADHSVIEPDLATEWWVSSDGLMWTFRLRDDVLWHDGTRFTADDAVFSLQRAIDPPAGIAPGRANAISRYVSDPEQIRVEGRDLLIETDFAAASFLPNLASVYMSVYPRAATEALDPPSMTAFETVISTGPFKAADAVRGSRYSLVRNDDYYVPGRPFLDEIEFLVIPESLVRMAALRSHDVDAIAIITEQEAAELESSFAGRITVFRTPSAGGNTVQMNLSEPPFDDARVRRAVNLAISRSDAELVLGRSFQGAILPPGGQFAYPESLVASLPGYGEIESNRRARPRSAS